MNVSPNIDLDTLDLKLAVAAMRTLRFEGSTAADRRAGWAEESDACLGKFAQLQPSSLVCFHGQPKPFVYFGDGQTREQKAAPGTGVDVFLLVGQIVLYIGTAMSWQHTQALHQWLLGQQTGNLEIQQRLRVQFATNPLRVINESFTRALPTTSEHLDESALTDAVRRYLALTQAELVKVLVTWLSGAVTNRVCEAIFEEARKTTRQTSRERLYVLRQDLEG